MRLVAVAVLGLALVGLAACSPPPKEYAYPAWGFAASFSEKPQETDQPAPADGANARTFLAETNSGGHDLVVSVTDAAEAANSADEILSKTPQLIADKLGGEVSKTTYFATGDQGQVMGREVEITKGGKPAMLLRIFVANGRIYQIAGTSLLGFDDPVVKRFLDSFRLTAK
jgi:hypothetical protein